MLRRCPLSSHSEPTAPVPPDASVALPPVCSYEGSDYRTAFWGQGRDYEDLAERRALQALLPARGQRLVDIGAGFGRLSVFYDRFEQVILVDYARSLLEEARQRLGDRPNLHYVVANVYSLPLVDGAVDALLMVRVLHHMKDAPAALGEVSRVLAGGGAAVLEYANKRNLKAMARRSLRRGPANPFSPEPWEFVPLNFNFHPRWMDARLQEAGLLVEGSRAVSYLRSGALKRSLPPRLLAAVDGWLQPTARWGAYSPSVFLRARRLRGASLAQGPLFRCPACGHAPLEETPEAHACPACGRRWPVENGIYIFREESQEDLSERPVATARDIPPQETDRAVNL
ncbi:MAG: methyltransferase domain-containing protein [Chloroflexi bacterium]|nr:methyltransferase domain-containing protein [Chloroflexota bacterium]